MTTNRREQVLRLYHQALARDPGDRRAFLADVCADDEELRRSVDALLAQDPPSGFLDTPAAVPEFTLDAASDADLIGQQVGPYRIDSRLGSGGMGHVFRAQDTKLGRDVAIKILLPEWSHDRERLRRFEREARVLATLNHPHVGAIYGLERVNGSLALVLELVEGQTLAESSGTPKRRPAVASRCRRRSCLRVRLRTRSKRPTRRGSSIATSSPATSSSPRMAPSRCWTSAWPAPRATAMRCRTRPILWAWRMASRERAP